MKKVTVTTPTTETVTTVTTPTTEATTEATVMMPKIFIALPDTIEKTEKTFNFDVPPIEIVPDYVTSQYLDAIIDILKTRWLKMYGENHTLALPIVLKTLASMKTLPSKKYPKALFTNRVKKGATHYGVYHDSEIFSPVCVNENYTLNQKNGEYAWGVPNSVLLVSNPSLPTSEFWALWALTNATSVGSFSKLRSVASILSLCIESTTLKSKVGSDAAQHDAVIMSEHTQLLKSGYSDAKKVKKQSESFEQKALKKSRF